MAETWVQVAFPVPLKQEFTYLWPADWAPAEPGHRLQARFGRRSLAGVVTEVLTEKPMVDFEIKPAEKLLSKEPLFGPHSLSLARWVAAFCLCSLGEALEVMLPSAKLKRDLNDLPSEPGEAFKTGVQLSAEQEAALLTLDQSPEKFFYLRGITGSGKTEVFLQAARRALDRGQSVLYLVPEIALTWQLVESLKRRFPQGLALIHSGLTPSQKLKEWQRIRSGQAQIVVGARSAVFAPVAQPGLIILDEEHETSYKSGNTPRYHARQVAMQLANLTGAKVLMGSATPSLEALHLMEEGKLVSLRLTQRLSGGSLPRFEVVNMAGSSGSLSHQLIAKILETRALGRQTILFLNRRGFSHFFHCNSCGFEMKCHQCSTALTYHKSRSALVCHYCGYQARPVQVCPDCGSLDVGFAGVGTEHIEEEIRRIFPDLRLARLDSDSVEKKGHMEAVIGQFERGELDLLLGTQMVAKGLNFPKLKLVGLINADTGLSLPDFRAAERVFALIRQVAGRAGRFLPDGEVLIQTSRPQHPVLKLAAANAEDEFWKQELEMRRLLGFPPFTRLIRLVFRSRSHADAETAAAEAARLARAAGVDLLGPAECPLALIASNHRRHLLLRGADFRRLHALTGQIVERLKLPHSVYLEIDVDPVSLL